MAETITAAAYHDGLPQKTEVDGRERVIVNDSGTDKTITAEVLRDYAAKEVGERVDTLQTQADANSDGLNKLAVWEAEATETGVTVQTRSAMSQTAAHSVEIPAATTTGAGVMTAAQAASLESAASTADKAWQQSNTNKTDIAAEETARKQGDADLLSQIDSTSKTLAEAIANEEQFRNTQITTTAEQLDKSIKEEAEYRLTQDNALQSQITQNKTDISANAAAIANEEQYRKTHIECIITDCKVVIQDAYRYVQQGLTPVIFRHTARTSRKKPDDAGYRDYLPERYGWNRFFDDGKLRVDEDGVFSFRVDDEDGESTGEYSTAARALFHKVREVYGDETEPERRIDLRVGFGKRSYDIQSKPHLFRFAIGFYKKSSKSPTFQFSELRTNLAEFRVLAGVDKYRGDYFDFSM